MTRKSAAVLALSCAILALVLLPAASFAAKGGSGGHQGANGGGGSPTSATLTVSPTTVASGDAFTASGCGYVTGKQVNVVVTSPSSQEFFPTGVDGSGCIWFRDWTGGPGAYTVQTYQNVKGNKQTLMASASVSVV